MASSSAKPVDDVSGLVCAICLGIYQKPKILPKCGHSFCEKCLLDLTNPASFFDRLFPVSSSEHTVTCPECRTESVFVKADGLKTNYAIQRMVDQLEREQKKDQGDHCQHVLVPENKTMCNHCNKKFCYDCLGSHKSRLNIDIQWLSNCYKERLGSSLSQLESKTESIEEAIDKNVEEAQKAIVDFTNGVLQKLVDERKEALLKRAREMGDAEKAKISSLIRLAKAHHSVAEIEIDQTIARFNEKSASLSELASLHELLVERDREIALLDNAAQDVINVKLDFKTNQDSLRDLSDNLSRTARVHLESPTETGKTDWVASDIQRLHKAAKSGDLEAVMAIFNRPNLSAECKSLIANHFDPISARTAMMEAAHQGHVDIVRYLAINQEAAFDARSKNDDDHEMMPVHIAAREGHLAVVQFLVEISNGDLIDAKTDQGNSPLMQACKMGHLEIVRFLVEEGEADLEEVGYANRTPLLCAVCYAHEQQDGNRLVEYLLSKKPNVYATDEDGDCAIHLAALKTNVDAVRLLLKHEPNLVDKSGLDDWKALHSAAQDGNLELVRVLVEEFGATVDCRGSEGDTPLFLAAQGGHLDVVKFLVEKGASLEARDKEGYLPIHASVCSGHTEIVDYLLELKPNLLHFKLKGSTLLDFATKRERSCVVELLKRKLEEDGPGQAKRARPT